MLDLKAVEDYLSTDYKKCKIQLLSYMLVGERDIVGEEFLLLLESRLKMLDYEEFLKTLYWACVKRIKEGRKCSICSSSKSLDLHHNTYKNHGKEHLHLEDLTYVCHRCHTMIHDNIEIGRGSEYVNSNFNLLDFDTFWLMYDKKREKKTALRMWNMLSSEEVMLVSSHIDYYLGHKKEAQYRMYPAKYLARFCSKKVVPNGDIQITRDIVHYVEGGVIYVR